MYRVHCQEQYLAGQLKRCVAESASSRVDRHMSEASLRNSRPLAFSVGHRSLELREFLPSIAEASANGVGNLHLVEVH